MNEQEALQKLAARRDQFAAYAKTLPPFERSTVQRASFQAPPARVQVSEEVRNQADDIMRAEADAKKVEQWRANLKKYAPIDEWELAWRAKSMPDHNPDVEHPDFYVGTQGVFNWLEGGAKKHLVLIGAIGCGKSIAAAVAVRKWVEPGIGFQPVCWMTADELVSAMFHPYDPASPKLCRYNVVDDMGDERKDDFEEALAKLMEKQDHRTIITTNLAMKNRDPLKTFRGRYTRGRMLSRMRAKCATVIVPGGSRRDEAVEF